MSEVKLSRVERVLEDLTYPVSREDVADDLSGMTLLYADGEEDLGSVVERTGSERFGSANELEDELYSVLPREAVGEPYQSEGEG